MISKYLAEDVGLQTHPIALLNIPDAHVNEALSVHTLLGFAPDHKIMVHTGSIYHSEKQLKLTLEAIQDFPTLHLLFVGNRPRFFTLRDEVGESDYQRIHFIEYDQYPLLDLLAGCHIGLVHVRSTQYLNHRITSSNKFMEYIRAELPVISTPHQLHKIFNEPDPFVVFYDEMRPSSFNQAIATSLDKLNEFRENVKKVSPELSWKKEVSKMVEAVQELLTE